MEKKNISETNNMKNTEMEFGVRIATHSILKELIKDGGHQTNLVLSPLSLHICLNLIAAGAKGPTLDQLLRFLNAENVAQLNAQSSLFMELVSPEPELEPKPDSPFFGIPSRGKGPIISMVNGIWVDQRYSLKHSFKQMVYEIYRANSQSVDFKKAEEVANEINDWAKEASRGHIDNLISSNSIRDSILVLASAIYFQASWLLEFNPSNTKDGDFYLLDGKCVRVPFMRSGWDHYIYKPFDGFKLLKMEYKEGQDGKKYSMDIFLPDRHDGLQELIQKFHSDPRFFTQNHRHNYVELKMVVLPKLKFEYGLNHLADNIQELGLDLPFQKNAELTDIVDSKDNVYVSEAIHKSYIEVNEEGTIATSVNAFLLASGCAMRVKPPPTIEFVADHPFLFVIKEELSGTVLFVGAALNPL